MATDPTIDPRARRRYAAGRRIKVPRVVKGVRDLLRRHLREEGLDYDVLMRAWNMTRQEYVTHRLWSKRPLSPQYIDAAIEALKLDEFDALELRLRGAIEAGWQIGEMVQLLPIGPKDRREE